MEKIRFKGVKGVKGEMSVYEILGIRGPNVIKPFTAVIYECSK
jgi:hypothetical protein